jgi:hypothetical protein
MSTKALIARCVLAVAIGSLAQTALCSPAPQEPATAGQIDQAIKDLGAQSTAPAQAAAINLLWRAGQAAVPALERAAKGADADAAARAKGILADIEWNLFPHTPKRVVSAIREYRAADAQKKEQLVEQAFQRTGAIMPVINRIMSHETDETILTKLKEQMVSSAAAVAPEMIFSGDLDKAQTLLEKAAMGDNTPKQMQVTENDDEAPQADDEESIDNDAIRHYVAFLLLSAPDKLDAKIKELSAAAATDKRAATILALAYRAKGDMHAALKVAKEHAVLQPALLLEAGDWKALAQFLEDLAAKTQPDDSNYPGLLGQQLAFYRLCGKKEEAQKLVEKIMQAAAATAGPSDQAWWLWSKQLLGSEYIDQPLKLLTQHPAGAGPAFVLLVSEGRFAEAFDVIDKAKDLPKDQLLGLRCAAIRLRYRLGQKEEALKKIKAILAEPTWTQAQGEDMPNAANLPNLPPQDDPTMAPSPPQEIPASQPAWALREPTASIILLYLNLGLKPEAYSLMEDAFKGLSPYAQSQYVYDAPRAATGEFRGNSKFWWIAISRQDPKLGVKERMEKLDTLLAGKLDRKELTALTQTAAQMPLQEEQGPPCAASEAQRLEMIVRVLFNYESFPDTRKYVDLWVHHAEQLPDGADGEPERQFAEYLLKHGKFAEAADIYHQAMTKNTCGVLAAMEGHALLQTGEKEEGQRLAKLANVMLLADEGDRNLLASNFIAICSQKEPAAKQYDLIMRLSDPPGDSRSDEPLNHAYSQAMKKKEFAQAARFAEILRISNMGQGSDWTRPEMFLSATVQVHAALAREAKEKGDWEKCAAEIALCQNALPLDNSQGLIDAINDLTKAGKTALADALFDRSWKAGIKTCQDWPGASDYFNSTAWLAVACHRKINEAFNLAQQAVEMDKKSAANLDTLAEIYFQKGDRAKAIELCKKCAELEAAALAAGDTKEAKMADYLTRQLKRLQTMDPSTSPPQLDEDE